MCVLCNCLFLQLTTDWLDHKWYFCRITIALRNAVYLYLTALCSLCRCRCGAMDRELQCVNLKVTNFINCQLIDLFYLILIKWKLLRFARFMVTGVLAWRFTADWVGKNFDLRWHCWSFSMNHVQLKMLNSVWMFINGNISWCAPLCRNWGKRQGGQSLVIPSVSPFIITWQTVTCSMQYPICLHLEIDISLQLYAYKILSIVFINKLMHAPPHRVG